MQPSDYDEPLLVSSPFNTRRVPKDRFWLNAFSFFWVICVAGGAYAWKHSNSLYLKVTQDYLNDPAHCPIDANNQGRLLLSNDPASSFEFGDFWAHAAIWLIPSVAASLLIGLLFLLVVRNHAFTLARATIAFQVSVPLAVALGLVSQGQFAQSLGAWLLAGISMMVFYLWRQEIAAATKLLSVAGHGLAANMSLLVLPIALNVVALLAMLPMLFLMAVAYSNGNVVPNPLRDQAAETCVDASGAQVVCCAWMPENWALGYMVLLLTTGAWTIFTLYQIRVYIVSGTIAQWYFSTVDSSTSGNMSRSIKHALGPSLGTNVFAGLVLSFTQFLQQQHDQAQSQGDGSIFGFITAMLASLLEYLTKFAVVFAAITGDALLPAGRRCTDLLARNLLTAIATTVWFPSALLGLASVTLSALWGTAIGYSYKWAHAGSDHGHELHAGSNAVVLGIVVGVTTLTVLSFLVGVLLSVLDAVFVCFALDRDRATLSNADVYQAFIAVASEKGIPVEQESATRA